MPETANQRLVREKLDEFGRTQPHGALISTFLHHQAVTIVEATYRDARKWKLVGVLPPHIRNLFDIQGDVLIFATAYESLHPRIFSEMQEEISKDARFDKDFCILATIDKNAFALAAQRAGELAVLPINPAALGDQSSWNLRGMMANLLGTIDHFNVTTPITSPPAFFGRTKMIRELVGELENGAHVGVFGLRKAGKSSLLAQVRGALKDKGWVSAWLDLGKYIGSAHLLVRDLVVQLAQQSGAKVVTTSTMDRGRINAAWLDDLAKICSHAGRRRVVMVLDEFDLATPGAAFASDRDVFELISILSRLRGFLQQQQSTGDASPVVLAAGINPTLVEKAHLFDRPNPLFQFLKIHYIEPFGREELAQMVRALGKKTGLKFTDSKTIDGLLAEYGGHPLLTRQACSYIHQHRPPHEVPHDVDVEQLEGAFAAKGSNTPLHHAVQAAEEFAYIFPDEAAVVWEALTSNRPAVDLDKAMHAQAYCLLDHAGHISLRALFRASQMS